MNRSKGTRYERNYLYSGPRRCSRRNSFVFWLAIGPPRLREATYISDGLAGRASNFASNGLARRCRTGLKGEILLPSLRFALGWMSSSSSTDLPMLSPNMLRPSNISSRMGKALDETQARIEPYRCAPMAGGRATHSHAPRVARDVYADRALDNSRIAVAEPRSEHFSRPSLLPPSRHSERLRAIPRLLWSMMGTFSSS